MSNWLNISGITIQSVDHIPPFHSNTRKTFSKSRALSIVSIQWKIYEPQYGDKDLLAPILLEIRHHHRCHHFKCFPRKDRYQGNFCSNYRYHKVQYMSLCMHFKVSTFETRPIKYWSELFKNISLLTLVFPNKGFNRVGTDAAVNIYQDYFPTIRAQPWNKPAKVLHQDQSIIRVNLAVNLTNQNKKRDWEWPGKVFNHYHELQLSALTRCSWFSWRDVTKSCSASKLITPPVQPRQCCISWHLHILPCNDSRVKSTGMLIWWASKPL